MRPSSIGSLPESRRTPTSAATFCKAPIPPQQAWSERRPEAGFHACDAKLVGGPAVAGLERVEAAASPVESVAAIVAGMIDPDRPSRISELEVGPDRGPKATIFFGPKPDLPLGIGRVLHPFDMHHAATACHNRPDRRGADVPPGR